MAQSGRRRKPSRSAARSDNGNGGVRVPLSNAIGFPGLTAQTTGATVVRLNREATRRGVAPFAASGLKIASSHDFKERTAPPGLDGADMIVFERFGIAIVEADPARVTAALTRGIGERAVLGHRPERIYRALGMEMTEASASQAGIGTFAPPTNGDLVSRDYLVGYLGGVSDLIGHLMGNGLPGAGAALRLPGRVAPVGWNESAATWGLQATNVLASPFSGDGIKVAILDTGIDFDHPDFIGREIVSKSFIADQEVQDGHGHGTHCAGTACGILRPSSGQPRYGIAHAAKLHVGKVLSNTGSGSDRSVMGGLEWALDNGCAVISMSLGSAADVNEPFIEDYELIGQDALGSGSLIIAAAGNESARPGHVAPVGSPANCPSIFAVAALDRDLRVARFSCGKRSDAIGGEIDIAAPGVDVFSSVPQPRLYARMAGTSMATPHVAGIAALYAELNAGFRGMALWGALNHGRRFLDGDAADIGAGLAQAPAPAAGS